MVIHFSVILGRGGGGGDCLCRMSLPVRLPGSMYIPGGGGGEGGAMSAAGTPLPFISCFIIG